MLILQRFCNYLYCIFRILIIFAKISYTVVEETIEKNLIFSHIHINNIYNI